MRNFKNLLIVFLCLSVKSLAQNGYTVTIEIKHSAGKTLLLSYYHGSTTKPEVVDSAQISNAQQHIEFKNVKKIIGGIYRLNFKNDAKLNTIDIAVDNNAKIQLNISDTNLLSVEASDKINQNFFLYQHIELNNLDKQKEQLNFLIANYPQSVVAIFAKLELKKMSIYSITADTVANKKIWKDYLTGIDLQDKRIQLLPNTYAFLYNFFKLIPITNQSYENNVDVLLNGIDCSNKNYIFYLGWIFKNFNYLQRYNLNDAFRYVYSKYLDIEPCKTTNQKFYDRITIDYKELDALIVGNTIPDFQMQDSAGKKYSIRSLLSKSKYTFLAFFDPDCSHCQEILPQVSAYFDSAQYDTGLVQKISFANASYLANWQKFLTDSKLQSWLNVKPLDGDQQYMQQLKVYTNPCFFLLDDTGIIRSKSFKKERLDAILKGGE